LSPPTCSSTACTFGCAIAGGDIARAPPLTSAVTVAGEVRRTTIRLRSGARPGDIAAITGPLGWAAAGLRILDKDLRGELKPPTADAVCNAYLAPQPRLREGVFLASRRACRALMDISDGLSTDIARMALASGVDATVDRSSLAPDPVLSEAARLLHIDPLELMLNGGDDYELLAAIEPRAYKHVARAYKARFGRELRSLGTFTAGDGHVWTQENKKRTALLPAGWDHLKM
jgi:thiamine-monophosphate kinase